MAHFTQLGLSGEPEKKPKTNATAKNMGTPQPQNNDAHETKFSGKQKTITAICSVMLTTLLGVSLLETGGCSKASKTAEISAPAPVPSEAISSPAAATQPMAPAPEMAKKPMKKLARQHALAASTYANSLYGVSFRYMKPYQLKEGDKANDAWTALKPAEMGFAQPGGSAITTVELPERLYKGTDFASAFFNVSVNPKLTAAECEQFASSPKSGDAPVAQDGAAAPAADAAKSMEPSKIKLGAAEFTEVANTGADAERHSDAKYYHIFQNGACYEFALGVQTRSAAPGMKAVNRNEVFRRLNWMLSTVKIQPAGVPEPAAQGEGTVGGGK